MIIVRKIVVLLLKKESKNLFLYHFNEFLHQNDFFLI